MGNNIDFPTSKPSRIVFPGDPGYEYENRIEPGSANELEVNKMISTLYFWYRDGLKIFLFNHNIDSAELEKFMKDTLDMHYLVIRIRDGGDMRKYKALADDIKRLENIHAKFKAMPMRTRYDVYFETVSKLLNEQREYLAKTADRLKEIANSVRQDDIYNTGRCISTLFKKK